MLNMRYETSILCRVFSRHVHDYCTLPKKPTISRNIRIIFTNWHIQEGSRYQFINESFVGNSQLSVVLNPIFCKVLSLEIDVFSLVQKMYNDMIQTCCSRSCTVCFKSSSLYERHKSVQLHSCVCAHLSRTFRNTPTNLWNVPICEKNKHRNYFSKQLTFRCFVKVDKFQKIHNFLTIFSSHCHRFKIWR